MFCRTLIIPCILLPFFSFGQKQSTTFGFQSNVHFSFVNLDLTQSEVEEEVMLRYSIGVLMRHKLGNPIKYQWGPLKNSISFYLDIGIKLIFDGHDYNYQQFSTSFDEWGIEIPLVFTLKAGNNILTRSWERKKIYAVSRVGVMAFYNPGKPQERSIISEISTPTLMERTSFIQKWSLGLTSGLGIQKEWPNQATSYFGISLNWLTRPLAKGSLAVLENTNIISQENFSKRRTYLSLDLIYLFGKKKKIKLEDLKPKLLCPRF